MAKANLFDQKATQVAVNLIGRKIHLNNIRAEILETEAFEGGKQTPSRSCMLLAPGIIGIMPFRGLNFLNIGTEEGGTPSCVMIRSIKVGNEVIEGPGKVGKILDAKSIEYKILGQEIKLTGRTKPSYYSTGSSENSLGIYRAI